MPSAMPFVQIPTLTVGGRVFTDLANLKVLHASAGGTGATGATFRLPNASTGYTVTAGKTLTILAVKFATNQTTAVSGSAFALGYADNDVGQNSATAFTNQILNAGGSAIAVPVSMGAIFNTAEFNMNFQVPATKLPCAVSLFNATFYIQIFGYET